MSIQDQKQDTSSYFIQLVLMFQTAAMQQMGKLMNPLTQKVERDLNQAKFSIDILGMLEEKTKDNLTEDEKKFLEQVLFQLRMNYMDELKAQEEKKSPKKEQKETEEQKPET